MVDGMVARRTNTTSEFGARLDTAADFVFVVICLIRLLPVMDIPTWLYVWTGVIALIKGINIVSGYVMQKRFVAVSMKEKTVAFIHDRMEKEVSP